MIQVKLLGARKAARSRHFPKSYHLLGMLRTIAFFLMICAPAAVLASGEGTGAPVPETAVLIVDRRPETVSL
ncbi:MAG: hypothetical protein RIE24_13535, partial [Silicimonas sp.]